MLRVFAAAWRFLTVFPCPLLPPGPDEAALLSRVPAAFPAVGAVLGLGSAGCVWLLACVLPTGVAAATAVGLLAGCSAGLHLDGLADSADGLASPGRSRERILEVMRDSRIGAHGAAAVTLVLLLKAASLASLTPAEMALTVFLMPLAGRAAIVLPMCLLPYVRPDGLGSAFVPAPMGRTLAGACVWTAGAMLLVFGLCAGLAGAAVWAAVALAWVRFLRRRLGGATGDTYGAACEISETTAAVAAAAVFG